MTTFHIFVEFETSYGYRAKAKFEGDDYATVNAEATAWLDGQYAYDKEGFLSDWEEWDEPFPTSGEGWELVA